MDLNEIFDNIPLENHIRTTNEMAFINLLSELGFREDKVWTPDEDELLTKLMTLANDNTNSILKLISEDKAKNNEK